MAGDGEVMDITEKAQEIVAKMTLEEKADFCSGKNYWETKSIDRLSINSFLMADGSNGVRKQISNDKYRGDNNTIPASCFPTEALCACSYDRKLMEELGEAIGDECLKQGVGVLLGPSINIKRSPLCGRNFDYYSEDPYISGEMGASFIKGVQSKGVGCALKHLAAYNQEYSRVVNDSVVDERALFDIYLTAFYLAIKKANPYGIISSYNRLNGVFVSESSWLLTDVLRDRFGFEGAVISDWASIAEAVNSVSAGVGIEMPYTGKLNAKRIIKAVEEGDLSERHLDKVVTKNIELALKVQLNEHKSTKTLEENHELARKIVEESSVLLKNDGILPLKDQRVAFIGAMAKEPRFQGRGSSAAEIVDIENPLDEAIKAGYPVLYAKGYPTEEGENVENLLTEALEVADKAETVVIFAGLPDSYEGDGMDRKDMLIPGEQLSLINEVAKVNSNLVVVLQCGSPVDMEWDKNAKAVLLTYLGGQAVGSATVNLLWGKVNPSGRLAETWPKEVTDIPCYEHFSNNRDFTEYRESIYVGYRYYTTAKVKVAYPFGHGLSYTKFTYDNFKVEDLGNNEFEVSVDITNIGTRDGAEVVQLYIEKPDSKIFRAKRELKEFDKVYIKAKETETVKMKMTPMHFAYYNPVCHGLAIEGGEYRIVLGRNASKERLSETVNVVGDGRESLTMSGSNGLPAYKKPSHPLDIPDEDFYAHLGYTPAYKTVEHAYKYDIHSCLSDMEDTLIGRIIVKRAIKRFKNRAKRALGEYNTTKTVEKIMDSPLRGFSMMGIYSRTQIEGLVALANGDFFTGMKKIHSAKKGL